MKAPPPLTLLTVLPPFPPAPACSASTSLRECGRKRYTFCCRVAVERCCAHGAVTARAGAATALSLSECRPIELSRTAQRNKARLGLHTDDDAVCLQVLPLQRKHHTGAVGVRRVRDVGKALQLMRPYCGLALCLPAFTLRITVGGQAGDGPFTSWRLARGVLTTSLLRAAHAIPLRPPSAGPCPAPPPGRPSRGPPCRATPRAPTAPPHGRCSTPSWRRRRRGTTQRRRQPSGRPSRCVLPGCGGAWQLRPASAAVHVLRA